MQIDISRTKADLGRKAALHGAAVIRQSIGETNKANIILATGASQFEMLNALVDMADIDWSKVEVFHLDEYVGMTMEHPASFRRYLKERFVEKLPVPIAKFNYIDAAAGLQDECDRLAGRIHKCPIDVAFIGIGENCHLAFNDPPADFETTVSYIVVDLDEACRRQQLGEGWFATLDDVPRQAISMSIRQIMESKVIVCSVPDSRKAQAVKDAVRGPITANAPASILQRHANCAIFLDDQSAALIV